MKLNKPYTNSEYADFAVYCNENGLIIEDKGDYVEAVEPQVNTLTQTETVLLRRMAYTAEVDPITAHISRLRDTEQTPTTIAKIESLQAERDAKVAEIKERYPYLESEAGDV